MSSPTIPKISAVETNSLKKFVSTLYADEPTLDKLIELVQSYPPEEIGKHAVVMKKAIQIADQAKKPPYDSCLMQRINVIISICEAEEENERAISVVSSMVTSDQHSYSKPPPIILPNNAVVAEQVSIGSANSQETRKRKYDETFVIQNPKNIRLEPIPQADHIYEWRSTHQRGYSIHIDGPKYVKGIINSIIRETKEDIGTILGIMERDDSATLILDQDKFRKKAIDIISKYGINCTAAAYRKPILKLWMNKSQINETWEEVAKEIKDYNFKNCPEAEFKFDKVMGSAYAQYVIVAFRVDSAIRDSIIKRYGKIFFRNRRIEMIDHFPFRRCYNCGSCKHFACTERQERCMRCGGPHNVRICKAVHPCCPTCRGSHEAFHITCPTFREEIERQMDKVDYTYTNILFARGF